MKRAMPHHFHGRLDGSVRGENDHRSMGRLSGDMAEQIAPRLFRHAQIRYDNAGKILVERIHGLFDAGGRQDLIASVREIHREYLQHSDFVINNENRSHSKPPGSLASSLARGLYPRARVFHQSTQELYPM